MWAIPQSIQHHLLRLNIRFEVFTHILGSHPIHTKHSFIWQNQCWETFRSSIKLIRSLSCVTSAIFFVSLTSMLLQKEYCLKILSKNFLALKEFLVAFPLSLWRSQLLSPIFPIIINICFVDTLQNLQNGGGLWTQSHLFLFWWHHQFCLKTAFLIHVLLRNTYLILRGVVGNHHFDLASLPDVYSKKLAGVQLNLEINWHWLNVRS